MKRLFSILSVVTLLLAGYAVAYATNGYMSSFNNRYGTSGTAIGVCLVCHTTTPSLNSYGNAFKNNAHNYATVEPLDSDNDGFTNIAEIDARTFPGNASSKSAVSDTTVPTITAFRIPATSTSLTVPVTNFAATDNVGVTGYIIKLNSTKPLATASGWKASAPASFTFANAGTGTKTLYAWVKDAAGNISARRSASVTIILQTDTTAPQITAFNMPATSTSLTVPIKKFTATDDVGVTGYLVKTGSAKPSSTDKRWRATPRTQFKFANAGTKTLYAWVKDAAGNISARRKDTVIITLTAAAASQGTTAIASRKTKAASAAGNLIPVPSGQQVFSYDPIDVPIASLDPASARPVGVGLIALGGDTLSMHVSISKFANPVNLYLTAYEPSEAYGIQPLDVYNLSPDNNFELLSDQLVPWRAGVTEADETIVGDIPISVLPKGTHMLVLTVVSPDDPNSYYQWVTYFTVQ
jgi:hypothetical protein